MREAYKKEAEEDDDDDDEEEKEKKAFIDKKAKIAKKVLDELK